jgi:hypothetical protein
MKKLSLFLTVCLTIIQINSKSQGIYIGAMGGYGFPSMERDIYTTVNNTYTSNLYSYGSGMSLGIYAGYMVTKNIGFELEASDKLTSSFNLTSSDSNETTIGTYKASMFKLTPAIRLVTGNDKLQVYMVDGMIIGFPTLTNEFNESFTSPANEYDFINTYSGGISIGFHGALGVNYSITDKIGVFAEFTGDFISWSPQQENLTTATENGTNILGSYTLSQKQLIFESTYSTAGQTQNLPSQSTLVYFPFSSIGVTIGIHFSLNANTATKK